MDKRLTGSFEAGAFLCALRMEVGENQDRFAARLGCSQSSIAKIEAGTLVPHLSVVRRAGAAFTEYASDRLFEFLGKFVWGQT